MRTGIRKFGASCKYHHPKHGVGSSAPVTLNVCGYPLRLVCLFENLGSCSIFYSITYESLLQGEKECSYYIMTGQCKFGVMCKFDHPQPAGLEPVVLGDWLLNRLGAGPVYGIMLLSPSATAYTGPYLSITSSAGLSSSSQKGRAFPERPGQPERLYYLRTGDCKFGATCKYHHPPDLGLTSSSSQKEHAFLERPGQPECLYYLRTGDCKFGAACKYHHPPELGFRRLRWRSRL
ncbi:hypothetical protein CDL12_09307 [Handroanthus impetiginosus]|uniref:C3H1-type domain-containing protein n=1 Tax=Handroanthus impetiginosus TaxID=429701 RepID=A0A2G9HKG2_9LAMI|nr:hypothetical protein CDL12_09307 [Handroanthus impetiginosus]